MDYQQTLNYLFSQLPMYQRVGKAAYKANLNNTLALDEYFGRPHRLYKTIHIAGTNGKGSVSHMLASVLMAAGYRVGLYTSPHLIDFRERIKVDGKPISKEDVVEFVQQHKSIFERIQPSFFEMTVALAFKYFADKQVDIAVIEVGLGGRLDSTNIITPELSVITNIGLDHTDLLGDTLQLIAQEKAGIIKPNIPVVISELQEDIQQVFIEKASAEGAPITFASEIYAVKHTLVRDGVQEFKVENKQDKTNLTLAVDLLGKYQAKNILGVVSAIDVLSTREFDIDRIQAAQGLEKAASSTGLLGRWQIINQSPLVICDTGHNVDGITQLVEQIANTPHNKLHMVIGMVGDKNIDGVLSLLPKEANYYFTKASIPRALHQDELSRKASKFSLSGSTHSEVKEALAFAYTKAMPDDLIFIGGSTFVVADALS
ncbi:MAG: folylpolyglutamate synthase/dihydrofolate synthase family protein [Tenuifilaceae bacterium]|jgi:dihydrofolate synthase/folylpolyglutamate synthase|nr:folylpolyglutamate synthase/dihydrofolate synthase family protein [Tenuifilaceae bacterium]